MRFVKKKIKQGIALGLTAAILLPNLCIPSKATPAADSPEDAEINYMRIENHTGPSGVPLGGTGVGYYEISPEGKFTRNCINNIHKSFVDSPDGMFLATWQDGHAARLQRDGDTLYGMQGYQDSYYTGLFPRLELDFENAVDGSTANTSFKANSGVVAQNIKDSSLPVAWYEVELTNPSDQDQEMSALFSWADLIGRGIRDTTSYNDPGFNIDGESGSWFYMTPPTTYAEDVTVNGWKGVHQTTDGQKLIPHKATFQNYNTDFMILAEESEGTTVTTLKNYTLGNQEALQDFVTNGSLQETDAEKVQLSDGSGEPNKATNASAVAVKTTVPAGETKTVRFLVTWYMPEFTEEDMAQIESKGDCDYNKYYHNFFNSIEEVAAYAIENGDAIYGGVMEWQQPILDSNMPEWLQFKQINSAYTLFTNGVMNKKCNFTTLEGEMGGFGGTMDQKMSSHPMYEKLFPELNLNENRQFANVPGASGEIQHFDVHYYVGISDFDPENTYNPTPNGSMIDNSGAWMVQMLNYYRQTGDDTYLKLYYDRMKASMAFMETKFVSGTQIPHYNTTYDDYSHPEVFIFSGIVYLNMLEIAQEFAMVNNDPDQAAAYAAQYEKTCADVEKLYITDRGADGFYAFGSNGEYISSDKASGQVLSDTMFSGAMAGQFMSRYSGTGDIVPFDNFVSHMKKFLTTSIQESNDYFAAKVYNWVTGQSLDSSGSRCWPFYLDSYGGMAAIQAGYVEDGLEILEHTQLVNFRQGYTWTQNLWNPGYSTYMTAPVVWFINDVLAGSAVDVPNGTLTLGPTTIPGTNQLKVPLYYPKYWAEFTYDQETGTASYEITKTFYEEGEEPITFSKLCIAPNGTATDEATTHDINFTVEEGAKLTLDSYKDEFAKNVARDKLLQPVNKYNGKTDNKIANGTGLTASYYKGHSTDKKDLVQTELAPRVDYTWNAGEYPTASLAGEQAYTAKYEGFILPKYGQTYELRFLLRGEETDMQLVFDGQEIPAESFKHDITNGNIDVPEGCTLNVYTVDLGAGELYPIELTYFNDNAADGGMMHLMWWSTLQTPDYIITERLYPIQSAYSDIPAINYCSKYGNIVQNGNNMEYVERDNWLLFAGVDFGDGMTSGSVSVLAGAPDNDVSSGGTVEVRKDSADGQLLATIQFTPTGDWNNMQTATGNLQLTEPLVGKQDICLVFRPESTFLFNLRSFVFHNGETVAERSAYHDILASSFDEKGGRVLPNGDGSNIEYIENGDWTAYRNVNFGGGLQTGSVTLVAAANKDDSNCKGGTVEVYRGIGGGDLLTTIQVTQTDSWGDYRTFTGELDLAEPLTGMEDITLKFLPEGVFLGNVKSFRFNHDWSAYESIPAILYSDKEGRIGPKQDNSCLEYIEKGNWVTYCGVDFGESYSGGKFVIEASSMADVANNGGTVEVHLDGPDGKLLSTAKITTTSNWEDYQMFEGVVALDEPLSGRQDICLVFQPELEFAGNVRSFHFTKDSGSIPAESVSLSQTELPLTVGQTAQLTATVQPDNATNKNVTWTTSDDKVAAVENGKVTAVAEGEATITVTTEDGGHTASCKVTVTKPEEPVCTADAAIRVDAQRDENGNAVFHITLRDARNIEAVQVNYNAENVVSITGENGFTYVPAGQEDGILVLCYDLENEHDGQPFECDAETVIATITVSGEKPTVKLNDVLIAAYDGEDGQPAYGAPVELIQDTATFRGFDINNDGKVDLLDVVTAMKFYQVKKADGEIWETAQIADVNGDEKVDLEDLIGIVVNIAR